MAAFTRPVILLLFSLLLLTISIAALNTLVPLWLAHQHIATAAVGFVSASYFLGNLIGAIFAGHLISLIGFNRGYYLAGGIFILSTFCLAISIDAAIWSFCRFFTGIACAIIWVVAESALLRTSTITTRGLLLAAYMVIYYSGTVIGNMLLNVLPTQIQQVLPWVIIIAIIAIVPLFFTKFEKPDKVTGLESLKHMFLLKKAHIGLIGCVIAGIILGILYGLLPLYLTHKGFSDSQIAYLMVILVSAGIIGQFPIDRLALKYGRATILKIQTLFIIAACLLLLRIPNSIDAALLLLGCFSFTLYPLSMAWGCAEVSEDEIVPMDQALLLSYTTGSLIGPLVTGLLMQYFNDSGLFIMIALGATFFLLQLIIHTLVNQTSHD